jgi:hypothetical protein
MAGQDHAFVSAAAAGNLFLMERFLFPTDVKRRPSKIGNIGLKNVFRSY